MKDESKTLSLRLPADVYAKIVDLAGQHDRSINKEILYVLRQYISNRKDDEIRVRREAQEARREREGE